MGAKNKRLEASWKDPDDAEAWSDAMFARAEVSEGDRVIRPATGTVTKRGRPRLAEPKQQISVRLDPGVIAELKRVDEKWQVVMQKVLGNWAKRQQTSRGRAQLALDGDVLRRSKLPARKTTSR